MVYCDSINCGYWYKGKDDDFPCCHFEGWWKPPCEENDYVSDDDYEGDYDEN